MDGYVVSVDRTIAAPASALFAIVADANRHPEIDGSGSVVKPKDGTPQELVLGSTFGMSMKLGLPYSMFNTVIEYEKDRRIAWQTIFSGPLGRFIGGRIWRYTFEPAGSGSDSDSDSGSDSGSGTLVTESWDISKDKQRLLLKLGPVGTQTAEAMRKTLDKLAALTEPPA